eukprot:CAMPEP_0183724946 /NCGR_PEP_ID=MMETSP0737-20130205/19153_1 /TAXON_ID=385413 /ORGANISM="Thalassiosira miniscula, Strain CCMP1093" /LENGTH=287 /DNA_ID=CAMNT_0025955723 /DNA_START=22 /DNA_END=885 /DNA_ORIENTATION=+
MTNTSSNAVWDTLESSNFGRVNKSLVIDTFSLPLRLNQGLSAQNLFASSSFHVQPFAPPTKRSALKQRSGPRSNHPQQVSFHNSVDVRQSLAPPITSPENVWYTVNEIKSMQSEAVNKNSPLRHSDQIDRTKSLEIKQLVLSSPLPEDVTMTDAQAPSVQSSSSFMPRAASAQAELNSSTPLSRPNPRDLRYQKLISEMDREVYISTEHRRSSTRRRLHHYCKVLDELDRQVEEGYMMINVQELAASGRISSGDSYAKALQRGRREATLAKAILMADIKSAHTIVQN